YRGTRNEEHLQHQEGYTHRTPSPPHRLSSIAVPTFQALPSVLQPTVPYRWCLRKSTTAVLNVLAASMLTACPALAPTTRSPGIVCPAKARFGINRVSRSPQPRSVGTRRSLTRSRTGTLGVV